MEFEWIFPNIADSTIDNLIITATITKIASVLNLANLEPPKAHPDAMES